MSDFFNVLRRELKGFLTTPLAYIFTSIFVLLISVLTFTIGGFFERGEASLESPFFQWHPLLMALFAPAISMRIWSEENRLGTLHLLFSLPVSLLTLVVGKYISAVIFMLIPLLLTFSIIITVEYLGTPDYGTIASGYLGSFLVLAAFVAISCFCSALTRSQVIAFILAVTFCMLLVLVGYAQISKEIINTFPGSKELVDTVASFSVNQHFISFRKGLVEFRSLLYFFLLISMSLVMTYIVLLKKQA